MAAAISAGGASVAEFAIRVSFCQVNPNFPTPNPSLPDLAAGADALEVAYNEDQAARLVSKTKTAVQDERDAAVDALVNQLASYVDSVNNGDAEIIASAEFAVRSTPAPLGELPVPADVQVAPSEHSGSADISWSSLRGAKAYVIERAPDAPSLNWAVIGTSTRAKTSLNSMTSGTKYWLRVAAISAAGQSAWSDPVPLFAP